MWRRRVTLNRAAVVLAVFAATLAPDRAVASVSLAVSWERLVQASAEAAIVTATDARSAWEGGHVYTYSHVHVDRAIAGALPTGADAWVRTLGGIVGDIGQRVEGEAQLVLGQQSLVFLQPDPNGTFHVTARAQGQFPVIPANAQQPAHVVRSGAIGALVRANEPTSAALLLASEALHGLAVDDAVREVLSAWSRTHLR
jgi:hypothetical protein